MKSSTVSLALILLTQAVPAAEPAKVKVVSFNVRYGTARDGANHWERRKEQLVGSIEMLAPDLLGTQETLAFQRDYLSEKLPAFSVFGVGRDDGREAGEMMAVYWRTARFEKLDGGHFWLSETPEKPGSKSWDSSLPRMATWVELRDRNRPGAKPVLFVNTHFDHRGPRARLESAKLVRERIRSLGKDCDTIVTGDFNSAEGSEPYVALFGTNGKSPSPVVDTYRTANPTRTKDEGTSSGFATNPSSSGRIDWIGCSRNWTVEGAGIDREGREGRYPSDHFAVWAVLSREPGSHDDRIHRLQNEAMRNGRSPVAHWGPDPEKYISWSTHSNRLVPVYTFGTRDTGPGVDLHSYTGEESTYRDERRLREVYGYLPTNSVSPEADYMDQTDVQRLQRAALDAGRKHVILIVFDGMDWETTRAAAIASGAPVYEKGRGSGLHFLDYRAGGSAQLGSMVTSPHNEGTNVDVNDQTVSNPGGKMRGGYDRSIAGGTPWSVSTDPLYPIGKSQTSEHRHAYTDSAASATSMTAGIKTYNGAINIDATGNPVPTIAHLAEERGLSVGVVTSVPISHATPAAAYAHNVTRNDYQDLSRDLLGLPSIAHSERPLRGVDVLLGAGHGVSREKDGAQGGNFVPGNRYLTDADLRSIDVTHGGKYVVAVRTEGRPGREVLDDAARRAVSDGSRLFGFFGVGDDTGPLAGHLPFATADGDFQPAEGKSGPTTYSEADVRENPTLAAMTSAALDVLAKNPKGFWLMLEVGDVDWANHDNNLDTSIGAVRSGDAAFRVVTEWVERHSNWDETVLVLTADHGHYLVLDDPGLLLGRD